MAEFRYRLYGSIVQADFALLPDPHVATVTANVAPRLRIQRCHHSPEIAGLEVIDQLAGISGRQVNLLCDRALTFERVAQRRWCLEIESCLRIFWRDDSPVIEYQFWPGGEASEGVAAFWLTQTFLPMLLSHLDATVFIHASAVTVNNAAVLFMAPSTGGKSTLARALCKEGFIADDKVCLRHRAGGWHAVPAHPYCRWQREAEHLGDLMPAYTNQAVPLALICELAWSSEQVSTRTQSGVQGFAALARHRIMNYDPHKGHSHAELAQLADAVPIVTLARPRGEAAYSDIWAQLTALLAHSTSI